MEIDFKKILKQKKIFLLILFSIAFNLSAIDLNAHPAKKHKPMVCILEEDRTEAQKRTCKQLLWFHRLCKLDQDCAILKLESAKKEIENLEDQLGGIAECGDIPFNHKAAKNTKVYQKPDSKSQIISKVKKDDELLFYAPSSKNENWYYVKVKKDNSCADGYVKAQFVVKKEEATEDVVVEVKKAELIKAIDLHQRKVRDFQEFSFKNLQKSLSTNYYILKLKNQYFSLDKRKLIAKLLLVFILGLFLSVFLVIFHYLYRGSVK